MKMPWLSDLQGIGNWKAASLHAERLVRSNGMDFDFDIDVRGTG